MAWTAPSTWVAGNVLTAAQLNQQLRDNMLTTAPALATAGGGTGGGMFAPTGLNAIAQRLASQTQVLTSESTTSTSYVALATAQAVTLTTGTQALVLYTSQHAQATIGNASNNSYAISGATTIAASDDWSTTWMTSTSNYFGKFARHYYHTGLTAGSNTFSAQFKSSAATSANFRDRSIFVQAY